MARWLLNYKRFYQIYVVPAAVFQAVIIGGGYATGREIVEYVTRHGAAGGLLAIAVIAVGFSLVLAVSFAFAQRFQLHDYRHFLVALLGPAWVLYEILFLILLVIVLAIVASAAGAAAEQGFALPYPGGVSAVLVVVVILNFFGRALVERALTLWTVLLMLGLVSLVGVILASHAGEISASFSGPVVVSAALFSGAQFAVYNSALIPVLVYCTTHMENTSDALRSGFVAGLFGVLPALLLHLIFLVRLSEITTQSIPTYWLLTALDLAAFVDLYFGILFGTIVLTAVGVLQGVNERLDGWRVDGGHPPLPRSVHAAIAGAVVVVSLLLARFGIIALVAQGYGALSWAFFVVFTLPLLTLGVWKMRKPNGACNES